MNIATVRLLFAVAGLYDFIIGLVFLLIGRQLFDATGVPQPNHWFYVQFGALMLVIFGIMFLAVARDPVRNRNLMPYGMLLKLSYVGLVGYYWIATDCSIWRKIQTIGPNADPSADKMNAETDVESFYHLNRTDLAVAKCQGLACFVARNLAKDYDVEGDGPSPRVYCLGKCYAAPWRF